MTLALVLAWLATSLLSAVDGDTSPLEAAGLLGALSLIAWLGALRAGGRVGVGYRREW